MLAVERVLEGYAIDEVAAFFGVDVTSVRRWCALYRRLGFDGLLAKPSAGRPRKLARWQEKIALRWLDDRPTEHGFDSDLWTAARFADLLRQEWNIELRPRYVCRWLRARGYTPQRPQRVPRERNEQAIATWLEGEWTRLKKKRRASAEGLFSLMKAGF